jgi:predicted  nucleic acid-binding Zn-ribbon protein
MDKGVPKITSPIKPPEISSMTHEENEEIHNQLSKLEDQLNELSARSITSNDLVNTQRQIQHMENKMNENKEHMENKMDENREQDGKEDG